MLVLGLFDVVKFFGPCRMIAGALVAACRIGLLRFAAIKTPALFAELIVLPLVLSLCHALALQFQASPRSKHSLSVRSKRSST